MTSSNEHQHFISLKWKIFFLLSLAMILLNGFFYFLHASNLNTEFKRDRDIIFQRNLQTLQGLLIAASEKLEQTGHLIPMLSGIKESLNKNNLQSLKTHLNNYWSILNLNTDIEFIAYYDKKDIVFNNSTGEHINLTPDDLITTVAQPTIADESPTTAINCQGECILLTAVPILSNQQSVGAIILGKSLNDLIISFNNHSSTNIGLLIDKATHQKNHIKEWDVYISALSNFKKHGQLLRDASKVYSLEELLTPSTIYHYQNSSYELRLYPMSANSNPGNNHIILIDDITDTYINHEHTKQEIINAGIMAVIVSEIIVLFSLWIPLSRLKRTASTLPLLAESKYLDAIANFKHSHKNNLFKDEIDNLDASAIKLSHQLKHLEDNVTNHEIDLAAKIEELKKERDFVSELLNTAQVIIITQDSKGKILLINKYGQQLTGYTSEDLRNKRFSDLTDFSNLSEKNNIIIQLNAISSGKRSLYKHESTLLSLSSEFIHVAWLHSHLENHNNHGPAILSVGLDITARIQAENHITWLADHDPLTQLYNRRKFQEEFEKILNNAKRYNHGGSLLFLDLDHFKFINDTLGHSEGDNLLNIVASELKKCVRSTDIIARFGGDEFVILMPEIDEQSTMTVAKKINGRLSNIMMPDLINENHKISISIGIAFYPRHGESVDEILANADIAMYHVKKRRRGSWHVYKITEHAKENLQNEIYWRQQIEHALHNDRFLLQFQPIFNLETNQIELHESLLRMLDNNENIVYPENFIPIAERNNLILDVDHHVLEKTIKLIHTNNQVGKFFQLTVNLSARSLADEDLLPLLKDLLHRYPISPKQLIFEITETTALSDLSAAYTLINAIKSMDCLFALDDFGAGFSSFHYLKQLPVDFIKIDGAFIQSLARNTDDQVLVRAMNDVARWFGKDTIAEHVEDSDTLELLKTYNVKYAQGFLLAKPASAIDPRTTMIK